MSETFIAISKIKSDDLEKNEKYKVEHFVNGYIFISIKGEKKEDGTVMTFNNENGTLKEFNCSSNGRHIIKQIALDFNIQFITDEILDSLFYTNETEVTQADYDATNDMLGIKSVNGKLVEC